MPINETCCASSSNAATWPSSPGPSTPSRNPGRPPRWRAPSSSRPSLHPCPQRPPLPPVRKLSGGVADNWMALAALLAILSNIPVRIREPSDKEIGNESAPALVWHDDPAEHVRNYVLLGHDALDGAHGQTGRQADSDDRAARGHQEDRTG